MFCARIPATVQSAGMAKTQRIAVGAVAYDPKVVTIWEMINDFFRARGIPSDYVLFSNYEAQVEALLSRSIDIACGIRNKVKPFWTSSPYCHCNFTVLEERYGKDLEEWTEALLQMDYNNPAHRTIMDMEGLKRWVRPQLAGYKPLFEAVEAVGYFNASA